jgi:hypothetical protein
MEGNTMTDITKMSKSQINKKMDSIDEKMYQVNEELINNGRGYEKMLETLEKADPLSLKYRQLWEERMALKNEVHRRYGPNVYKCL